MTDKAILPLSAIATASASGRLELKKTGIKILDPDLTYEEWSELLFAAAALGRMSRWWVGDLILWGEGAYDERFSQALSLTGLAEGTIRNIVTVCKHISVSRRRERLGISMHQVVLPLPPREQDYWLRRADQEGWTREAFRASVDGARNGQPSLEILPPGPLAPVAIAEASGSLVQVRDTLSTLADGGLVPAGAIPKAVQAIERVSETLRVAATVPTIRDLVARLLAESEPGTIGGTSLVLTATLDELRALVGEEVHV